MKKWVVERVGPVEAVVALAGGDAQALREGRVFIGRRRAQPGDAVKPGDEVLVHAPSLASGDIVVIHRGDGVVAVDKPAGIPTIPDQRDAAGSLLHRVARQLDVDSAQLHPTSRLDRGVSGVVLFASSDRARTELREARQRGDYHRRYIGIAERAPAPEAGRWEVPIGRARDPSRRQAHGRDAVAAATRYRVVARATRAVLLLLEPETGRTHQIRVHASHAGTALLGDRDYGGARTTTLPSGKVLALDRVALHCAEVRVLGLDLRASVPAELIRWWRDLGGEAAALEQP